ncbi:hypothetical protein [Krasilnikovia sp. M28-CT-15]|uniref:hypothetical protein n=1 Tax=Krasilnikovia sp. M28-CT-15 TaxID=3373540 RepID=UPI003875EE04
MITVPAQPGAAVAPDAGPPPAPAPGEPARLWRRTWWCAALVPMTVLTPLVTTALTADHRFNVYLHGAELRQHPLSLVTENIRKIPYYLGLGNFRPFGRMLEDLVDFAAYLLMALVNLPANIALRTVSMLAAAVVTAAAVLLVQAVTARGPVFRTGPTRLAALVPFAIGAAFVAGRTSTTLLFSGLYLLSTALVLTVAAVACRAAAPQPRPLTRAVVLLAPAAGAFLAAFNEIAYLALPLASIAVYVRARVVLGLSGRASLTGPAARLVGLLWLGFLPVFVPVRLSIARICAEGGCYTGSDVALGAGAVRALPNRLLSWLPPLQWQAAADGIRWSWLAGPVTVVALLVLTLLAWRTAADLPRCAPVDRRQALGVGLVAVAVLVLGAALAALGGEMQAIAAAGRWGVGWRDSGLTAAGGMLALLAGAVLLTRSGARALGAVLVVCVLAGAGSAAANRRYLTDRVSSRAAIVNNAVAHEVADFDRSAAGDARRCALRAEFAGTDPRGVARFDAAVNQATAQMYGRPFCAVPGR